MPQAELSGISAAEHGPEVVAGHLVGGHDGYRASHHPGRVRHRCSTASIAARLPAQHPRVYLPSLAQFSTRRARSVFQRLGLPSPSSMSRRLSSPAVPLVATFGSQHNNRARRADRAGVGASARSGFGLRQTYARQRERSHALRCRSVDLALWKPRSGICVRPAAPKRADGSERISN